MRRRIPTLMAFCVLGAAVASGASRSVQTPTEEAVRLRQAAVTMGAMRPMGLEYSGSGSTYTYSLDEAGEPARSYSRLRSYIERVDMSGPAPAVEVTRQIGGDSAAPTRTETIDATSPADAQLALWLNPQVFFRHALEADDARFGHVEELGVDYLTVSFTTPGGRTLTGYLNPDNELRRIRTEVEDPVLGTGTLEASFMDYQEFGNLRFPSVVIHKQDNRLKMVVVVTEVDNQTVA
jgi:hypothetical protein